MWQNSTIAGTVLTHVLEEFTALELMSQVYEGGHNVKHHMRFLQGNP